MAVWPHKSFKAAAWHRDAVSSLVLSSAFSPEAHQSLACHWDGMACPLQE